MERRLVAVAVVALALTTGVSAGSAAAAGGFGQEQVDPDRVVLGVALQPDGDAVWTVEYRVRLATDNETAAFAEIERDVAANESLYTDRFRDRMARTAATAANATGREMAVRNVSVTAEQRSLPQTYGVLTYRFEWTNFAAVDGETLRAGDALAGLFLDEQTTLRVAWPDGYAASQVEPAADQAGETEAVWRGPREFGPDEPAIVVAPATTGDAGPVGVDGAWLGVAALALVGVAAVAAYWRRRSSAAGADEGDIAPASGGGADDGGAADGGDTSPAGDAEPDDGPPSELLSNEERVLALLESNGGRLKQQAVAERLDWTAAKTSQVIGDMREADAVETFRLGRENVVTLPDEGLGDDLGPDEDQ